MARKTFCDRCNKEIIGMPYTVAAGMKESYDLCQDCKEAFIAFMKGAQIE